MEQHTDTAWQRADNRTQTHGDIADLIAGALDDITVARTTVQRGTRSCGMCGVEIVGMGKRTWCVDCAEEGRRQRSAERSRRAAETKRLARTSAVVAGAPESPSEIEAPRNGSLTLLSAKSASSNGNLDTAAVAS